MKLKQIELRTKRGRARVLCESLAKDDKIIFAMEPHILHSVAGDTRMPAGVAYVMNHELAHRSHGRVRHQIVEGGLFHLVRLCGHVTAGNTFETRDLLASREEIRSCADFLLVSGVMTQEECDAVLNQLKDMEADFDAPKRVEEKLTTAARLRDAHARKASGDRRKIAPAAMTAYAGVRHVNRRVHNLFHICRYFTVRTLGVHAILSEYRTRVEEAWRFVEPIPRKKRVGASHLAEKLLEPRRDPKSLQLLMRQARGYATAMRLLKYQPYRSVAHLAADQFDELGLALSLGNREKSNEAIREVRRSLRRLRMVAYLETELIGRLSVYLEQTPKDRQSLESPEMVEFRKRFERARRKIKGFRAIELDPNLTLRVVMYLNSAHSVLEDTASKLEEVKAALSAATVVLAQEAQDSVPLPKRVATAS